MAHQHNKSRRKFLGTMGCASLGLTPFLSTITNLGLINALSVDNMPCFGKSTGYKALVCLALDGGNDSFNMLVPNEPQTYLDYANTRGNLALNQSALLPITSGGTNYGLHPNLVNIKNLYDSGNIAFVANVGTLIEATNATSYNNGSNLPIGLYSHLDQMAMWQTSVPQERTDIGWGGRMADILESQHNNSNISMNISLDGVNIFQKGVNVTEYAISAFGGGASIDSFGGFFSDLKVQTLDNIMNQGYQDILKQGYANIITNSQSNGAEFNTAINSIAPLQTNFPTTIHQLPTKLEMVAKTISARNSLGMNRQVFFVQLSGFDTHGDIQMHHNLMQELDTALQSFWDAMIELNLTQEVTLFTISDFARTLTSNGTGSDHAWGGNCMVMGGAVNGAQIYGQYPSLALGAGNPLDIGEGRLIPTSSCDEYFAELALWFAHNGSSTLSGGQLQEILPNINNFWIPQPSQKPFGFMA